MNLRKKLGIDFGNINPQTSSEDQIKYINFKLAALGLPVYRSKDINDQSSSYFIDLFDDIIKDYQEKTRLVDVHAIGINKRINAFFCAYFENENLKVVDRYFTLDHYGLARELSLPPDQTTFSTDYIKSYRIKQGVLHNPRNDRRTTKGSFHIVDGGLNIPFDKKAVPKETFAKLYTQAVNPPQELNMLPFTSALEDKAYSFVSLLVKPVVSPEVPGVLKEKQMEVQFIAPGSLVANLDFVESVFGNAGDPSLHVNDAGLDVDGWSGHTGYIILAPHLPSLRKIDLGLPRYEDATPRQIKDGMCYKDEAELYNDGVPFKITCRDEKGVAITLIGDNYFGYSKKEIKTQIGFAANLYGNVEEEHAGGTIAYPRMNLGENYNAKENLSLEGYTFEEIKNDYGDLMDLHEDNYGIDKENRQIIYLPENVEIDLHKTQIKWIYEDKVRTLKLLPTYFYILPNGDKIHMEKHPAAPAWKLIGTEAEGTFCHKPCTVSGGGKSEISKSLSNSIIYGTYYVHNLENDLNYVERILNYDYTDRWKMKRDRDTPSRPILSIDRTLGSVIKLLTPSSAYTDVFNAYINEIPNHVKALVFMVKRFYQVEWANDWRNHFTVDQINGKPGNEINFNGRKIRPSYLRVGFGEDNSWRVFKLRMDFMPSEKIQMEDDISASVVVPSNQLKHLNPEYSNSSYKFSTNCEFRFFQRPDDAIHKGYDKQAEKDLSSGNLFVTNYAPLTKDDVQTIKDDVMGYISYTDAVKNHITEFLEGDDEYCVVSSEPRIVDGAPSKNPRYLETRSDFITPIKTRLSELGARFARRVPLSEPVLMPVNAILAGRRNNPPGEENGKKILPLSVYSPIHYQELPELFMDYISSLTGKSPSTTGAGSEGALTKAPFNMLLPIYDLNNALLSYILGDYAGYTTPAGHIGPKVRVDHDISMLVPEIWARLTEVERNPELLIENGALEKIEDFVYEGELIPASRLGYRITDIFAYKYLGKIFDEPQTIFSEEILRPEKQSLSAFVDGVLNIANGHKKAADAYFEDGSVEAAIPPLKALLSIMATGSYDGHDVTSDEVRRLFKKDVVLDSDWYQTRLKNKQQIEIGLIKTKIANIEDFIANPVNQTIIKSFAYDSKLTRAKSELAYYESKDYLDSLVGTLGADGITLKS
ncbi:MULTISPECIES: hypothetical protein [unclassified Fusibacter]|uniref:hypothetical protein n=1 Tax=unclassified Fusibacter TaxID=2624464 RepID=UPI00101122BB|nr:MULTISPECIES: hypothetical protein [unclassified Fusibacter]MCK8061613.1 hypothetical protein [Fusibacter sp. A2]NPE23796.1 hypothetical protein [Fusibacter sp. A1]RXV58701.1 hypothetical protein DWB64_18585 [Fusibacter sp. A1]